MDALSSCGRARWHHTQFQSVTEGTTDYLAKVGMLEDTRSSVTEGTTDYLAKVGMLEDTRSSVSFPSPVDDSSDEDEPSAPQSVEDTDSDTKQPTDTGTGVAKPKNQSKTKGRIRTVFSEEQLRLLLQRFHQQRYISPQERAELARALGLSCKQVKTWYQNRRMKMKRMRHGQNPANYWDQPNFSAGSCQPLPPAQTSPPDMMQSQFLGYGQEYFQHSGQVPPFGMQNPPLENPVTKFLPPATMHGDAQNPASFYLQNSQLQTQPGPHFGNYGSEPPMIPAAPGFTGQVQGSGGSHPSVGNAAISYSNDRLHCFPSTSSYPSTQAECSYPSGAGVAGSSQGAQVYANDWASVKSEPVSGHMMYPMQDAYNSGMPTLGKPMGQGLIG